MLDPTDPSHQDHRVGHLTLVLQECVLVVLTVDHHREEGLAISNRDLRLEGHKGCIKADHLEGRHRHPAIPPTALHLMTFGRCHPRDHSTPNTSDNQGPRHLKCRNLRAIVLPTKVSDLVMQYMHHRHERCSLLHRCALVTCPQLIPSQSPVRQILRCRRRRGSKALSPVWSLHK